MTYQIADEPIETSLGAYVVRPSVPLLAFMLGGAWLSWPWFAFNALAMGSPTRRKEVAMCAAAFAITGVLAAIVIALFDAGLLPEGLPARLAVLAIVVFKIGITYAIHNLQERTFHVYTYYGGKLADPRRVLVGAILVRGLVIGLVDHPLWVIIVSGGWR